MCHDVLKEIFFIIYIFIYFIILVVLTEQGLLPRGPG